MELSHEIRMEFFHGEFFTKTLQDSLSSSYVRIFSRFFRVFSKKYFCGCISAVIPSGIPEKKASDDNQKGTGGIAGKIKKYL